jgi:hypothetical protein
MNVEIKNNASGLLIGNGAADDAIGFFGTTPAVQPSGAAQAAVGTTIATNGDIGSLSVVTNGSIAGLTFSSPAGVAVANGAFTALSVGTLTDISDMATLTWIAETLRDDVSALQTTVASHANEVASLRDYCEQLRDTVASLRDEAEKVGDLARANTTLTNKLRADLVTLGLIKGST